jgi:molybdate transport repressor ModE-like protein
MTDISDSFRWLGVELRHLLALRAVAQEGSLAAAGRRLGYSQPAVSQQLATLERLVGMRLVERRAGGREVALTEAGKRVLRHGSAMLARAQAAAAELRGLEEGTAGPLRLGTIPSVGARVVPRVLRRFTELEPAIEVELAEDGDDQPLLDQVEAGELNLTFAVPPVREGPFDSVEVLHDPYVLLAAPDSPLAKIGDGVSVRRLAKEPLIVCSQSHSVDDFLNAHGIAAQVRYRIEDNETIIGLAAAGMGLAILPRLVVGETRADVVQLELATKPPPRLIALVCHADRELTGPVRTLIDVVQEVCAELTIDAVPAKRRKAKRRQRSTALVGRSAPLNPGY